MGGITPNRAKNLFHFKVDPAIYPLAVLVMGISLGATYMLVHKYKQLPEENKLHHGHNENKVTKD